MSTVRLRRLQADFQKLQDFVRRHPRVRLVQMDGNPPERYQLQYEIRSLTQKDDQLVEATHHLVEIFLPRTYPRLPPQCRMLTPIFHPNIAPHAICIGDHWSAGETLSAIVARVGELLAYQSYNTKSPLNGEAARWTNENLDRLPLDPVSMVIEEEETPRSTPVIAPPAPPAPAQRPVAPGDNSPMQPEKIEFLCPSCSGHLRVRVEFQGKSVRCPSCKTVIKVPERTIEK